MELINILADASSICTEDTKKIFEFVGNLLTIIKIVVPIILVVMGSIDLAKAVLAQKDDEIKKAYGTLIKRIIIGVVIFFLPGIVSVIINLVDTTGTSSDCWDLIADSSYTETIESTQLEITSIETI